VRCSKANYTEDTLCSHSHVSHKMEMKSSGETDSALGANKLYKGYNKEWNYMQKYPKPL